MDQSSSENTQDKAEYLSFRVGEHLFCVDIMSVREIRSWTRATPLPHAPQFVRGVINLRGTVLPILDLASRLDFAADDNNPRRVVIVVKDAGATCGLLVDSVSDILMLGPDEFQNPPELHNDGATGFISALVVEEDRMIRRLDLSRTIATEEAA